jgi:NAD(P)-dependent dehydrogenase (short-subunit alcohol dehydrogenase family)
MTGRLRDKRCLIVGGTSGIGQAAAVRFREEGARIVAAGLPDCDATVPENVDRLFEEAAATLGGLDVLYHVAGGSGRRHGDGSLHECTDDGWRWTLDANITSTFLTNRAAVRRFLAQKTPGVILNMASILALAPAPRHFDTCAYAAAKGGVISLSRYAAARYAADGIRVNVLAPGLIDTPMAARAVGDEAIQRFLATKQPLIGGAGAPEDCAGAAVFLCSDEARLITGAVLAVDGGWCVSDGQ